MKDVSIGLSIHAKRRFKTMIRKASQRFLILLAIILVSKLCSIAFGQNWERWLNVKPLTSSKFQHERMEVEGVRGQLFHLKFEGDPRGIEEISDRVIEDYAGTREKVESIDFPTGADLRKLHEVFLEEAISGNASSEASVTVPIEGTPETKEE